MCDGSHAPQLACNNFHHKLQAYLSIFFFTVRFFLWILSLIALFGYWISLQPPLELTNDQWTGSLNPKASSLILFKNQSFHAAHMGSLTEDGPQLHEIHQLRNDRTALLQPHELQLLGVPARRLRRRREGGRERERQCSLLWNCCSRALELNQNAKATASPSPLSRDAYAMWGNRPDGSRHCRYKQSTMPLQHLIRLLRQTTLRPSDPLLLLRFGSLSKTSPNVTSWRSKSLLARYYYFFSFSFWFCFWSHLNWKEPEYLSSNICIFIV